ncbi:MAG: N-acetylmuramic acid 6-phosphate etherase [Pirellulaceae bacterium]|nr:MAG: N-acetylmuramic acid 6-phosphate etherase [Pirellulaceae bacterium]
MPDDELKREGACDDQQPGLPADSDPLGRLVTERPNPISGNLDQLSALEIVRLINAEDARVPQAVAAVAEPIAAAVELIADRLRTGGRLVYLGAGTSGRLGVLDAAECPPTFNTRPEQVIGLIAGGPAALVRAVEGAEDNADAAAADLRAVGLSARDVVVGIATSGRTPYVVGGLRYARQVGASTVGLVCNDDAELRPWCDIFIAPVVGPEVLAGSTRMKAGTATKLVLNTLSTGAMVLLGKTYGNLMVDLRATNTKLMARARRIVCQLTGLTAAAAESLLARCDGEVKTAVVVARCGVDVAEARRLLEEAGGRLRQALEAGGHPN